MQKSQQLDSKYPARLRKDFAIPTFKSLGISNSSENCIYFCGNSLGLMPLRTEQAVVAELNAWKQRGVNAHFDHPTAEPWVSIDDPIGPLLSPVLGAKIPEVAVMNTLTGNLHTMMAAFYLPTKSRYKILYEKKAFPSDDYAFKGIAELRGYQLDDALIALEPRAGEYTLRTEDILKTIEENGQSIAIILFSGIQFYTGQFFDIPQITAAGHSQGALVGWDLAHAVGNVPLKLHDWNVDFAVFCTYKYLNSGPGSIAGIFVHEKHATDKRPRLAGWWGNNPANRFAMADEFDPIPGAQGYRMSNPSVLNTVCLGESLKLFEEIGGIESVRQRSLSLTGYLYELLTSSKFYTKEKETKTVGFTILTPENPSARGAQLSLLFFPADKRVMDTVFDYLNSHGVVSDERKPDVIRLAPNAFYNTHEEVEKVCELLEKGLEECEMTNLG